MTACAIENNTAGAAGTAATAGARPRGPRRRSDRPSR